MTVQANHDFYSGATFADFPRTARGASVVPLHPDRPRFVRAEHLPKQEEAQALQAIVGQSDAICELRRRIEKVADLDVPILVTGETGTGKELVARALHALSRRCDAPLITVNTAALPADLVESELFGYVPGAFTGADRRGKKGRFQQADGGTIFLDEIGDMPMETQVKLLRVLQEKVVEPVGGDRSIPVNFRLVTATHRDLPRLVREGRFRLDLYYRISVVNLAVPTLAERKGDLPRLVQHFLAVLAPPLGHAAHLPTQDVMDLLDRMPWPGNVRQLQHALERALIFSENGCLQASDFADLPASSMCGMPADSFEHESVQAPASRRRVHEAHSQLVDGMIRDTLQRLGGNRKRAAEELGISRSYLYKRLHAMGTE